MNHVICFWFEPDRVPFFRGWYYGNDAHTTGPFPSYVGALKSWAAKQRD
jgi:hypothetical protein